MEVDMIKQSDELKAVVLQVIREELGDFLDSVKVRPPYEDEDLFVFVQLKTEPPDLDERRKRLHRRLREMGHDVGLLVDYPDKG
jgi:hypothetical protein